MLLALQYKSTDAADFAVVIDTFALFVVLNCVAGRKPGLVTLLRTFAATCVLIFFDSTAPRTQVTPHFIYRFQASGPLPVTLLLLLGTV